MKVRILNEDGKPWNTRVLDAETGELIEEITALEIDRVDASKQDSIKVYLEVYPTAIDLIGEAEFYTRCPHCGERIQGVAKEET